MITGYRCRLAALVAAVVVVLESRLPGQQLIRSLQQGYWPRGSSILILPRLDTLEDRDGDGLDEFLVGDYLFHSSGVFGRVSVVASQSGLELAAYSNSLTNGAGMSAVALGDLDADGVVDFGSASWDSPNGGVMIWSGDDLSLLYRQTSPVLSLFALGDVTGDGLPEVGYGGNPLRVLSGGTFEELYSVRPDSGGFFFSWRSVSLGDVNGDRSPDFAVSAPNHELLGGPPCRQAWIYVYSGSDGAQLYRIQGRPPCDNLGISMVAPGDVSGDGVGDLAAVSAFRCVQFFDGQSGALLGEACNERNQPGFGFVMEGVGDINANGFGDVLAYGVDYEELPPPFNQPGTGMGEAWLIDGGTREFLYRLTYPRRLELVRHITWGQAFTACGDWNDDGQPDLAIAAPSHPTNPAVRGAIDVFSGHPVGVRSLPEECGRSADGPRIGASGVPVLGRTYPIHLTNLTPGTRAWLVIGSTLLGAERARLGTALGPSTCGLRVRPDLVLPSTAVQAGGKVGAATALWKITSDSALVGTRVHAQWILPKSGQAFVTSRVLEITIQASLPLPYIP